MGKCVLLTGGVRSGKSRFAQELAEKTGGPVLFVATAEARDAEMLKRITEHKKSRPTDWGLLEVTTGVGRRIAEEIGPAQVVILDCVTLLVNNVLEKYDAADESGAVRHVEEELNGLEECIAGTEARFIIVTNEVGMGLVPDNPLGRLYRDLLGKVNRRLAERADEVYIIISGLPVKIKPPFHKS